MDISFKQIKMIHTLKNLLGLDDDLYADMLMSFGVQTSKNLTSTEANILISILKQKAVILGLYKPKHKKFEDMRDRENMATPEQLRMIYGLWRNSVYCDNPISVCYTLRRFLRNKFKVDDMAFLTKTTATKVIQAILIIKKRTENKQNLKQEVHT